MNNPISSTTKRNQRLSDCLVIRSMRCGWVGVSITLWSRNVCAPSLFPGRRRRQRPRWRPPPLSANVHHGRSRTVIANRKQFILATVANAKAMLRCGLSLTPLEPICLRPAVPLIEAFGGGIYTFSIVCML